MNTNHFPFVPCTEHMYHGRQASVCHRHFHYLMMNRRLMKTQSYPTIHSHHSHRSFLTRLRKHQGLHQTKITLAK